MKMKMKTITPRKRSAMESDTNEERAPKQKR